MYKKTNAFDFGPMPPIQNMFTIYPNAFKSVIKFCMGEVGHLFIIIDIMMDG